MERKTSQPTRTLEMAKLRNGWLPQLKAELGWLAGNASHESAEAGGAGWQGEVVVPQS